MSTQPPNDEPPGDSPIHGYLDDLARRLPVATIDEIWIFPTRRIGDTESTVLVVSALDEPGAERRRILTARYSTRRDKRGRTELQVDLAEHGAAPADRISRLIDGVLRRLDPELADTPPLAARIAGDPDRWAALPPRFPLRTPDI